MRTIISNDAYSLDQLSVLSQDETMILSLFRSPHNDLLHKKFNLLTTINPLLQTILSTLSSEIVNMLCLDMITENATFVMRITADIM